MIDQVGRARAAHDESAAEIIDHVIGCTAGCTMQMTACAEGARLAEAERANWYAYYEARYGPIAVEP